MPLAWSPSLAIGVEEIDAQHEELFRRAERLVRALRTGDRAGVDALFTYLAGYAEKHFLVEERLMEGAGYPGLAAHRAAHARFRDDLEARKVKTVIANGELHRFDDFLQRSFIELTLRIGEAFFGHAPSG